MSFFSDVVPPEVDICKCGHDRTEHLDVALPPETRMTAQTLKFQGRNRPSVGHGACMYGDCNQFTWARWAEGYVPVGAVST